MLPLKLIFPLFFRRKFLFFSLSYLPYSRVKFNMPKPGFYAVKSGRVPGIYATWAECEAQVKGFSSAKYKKFESKSLAEEFMGTQSSSNAAATTDGSNNVHIFALDSKKFESKFVGEFIGIQSSSNAAAITDESNNMHISASDFDSFFSEEEDLPTSQFTSSIVNPNSSLYSNPTPSILIPPTSKRSRRCYYAVHRGKKPGIYRTWTECEEQIKDFRNPSYRKFDDEEQAKEYMRTGGIVKATKRELRDITYSNKVIKKRKKSNADPEFVLKDSRECVVIFTDGASAENGKRRAKAGIGVYWGPNHPLNTSKRLPGRQTNNRAEIHAAIHALHQAKEIGAKQVKLYTDSQFLIHAITDWITKWKKNGWKLVSGEDVVNKEDFLELEEVGKGLDVEWIYVKAHARNHGNDEADRLAVAGARLRMHPDNFSKYSKINNPAVDDDSDSEPAPFILTSESSSIDEIMPLIIPKERPSKVYYAVHRGKSPGVYTTWTECEEQIKDFIKPWFKKFSSKDEAMEFVKTGKTSSQIKLPDCKEDDFVPVFTDGASSNNGQEGAAAGIGVYWGPKSKLNTSMRLPGRQTNNRAEIFAAVHALRQAKHLGIKNVKLYTDSKFVINGITVWIDKWKQNNWTLASGKPVKNKEDFLALDEARQGLNVVWCHVKGHANNPGNIEADKLAVEGCTKKLSEAIVIA